MSTALKLMIKPRDGAFVVVKFLLKGKEPVVINWNRDRIASLDLLQNVWRLETNRIIKPPSSKINKFRFEIYFFMFKNLLIIFKSSAPKRLPLDMDPKGF